MMTTLHGFPDAAAPARRLARALGIGFRLIGHHHFPDGESQVRVGKTGSHAILFQPLHQPNARLVDALLAGAALRDGGANRVTLVAPYLGYMRQDRAFRFGEAVSQRVVGELIAGAFDGLVTVDPHLHRTPSLASVTPGITALAVSAAPAIAAHLQGRLPSRTVLVGPDAESRPWVEAVATPLGLDWLVAAKRRRGDRSVAMTLPAGTRLNGRPALIVDDLLSSGGTVLACAQALRDAGARRVGVVATHYLASADDLARLRAAGIAPIMACNTVPGPAARIPVASVLAAAIRKAGLLPD
jgi:ribose-phosphate pyrophosphokinase